MKHADLKQRLAIVYALAAVSVVVLVVVGIVIVRGTNEDDPSSSAKTERNGGSSDSDDDGDDSKPSLRTIAQQRSRGKFATANASGIIDRPKEIWLRVSAAPKQKVSGQWNVSCGAGATDSDTFTVTPPNLMKLRIPRKKADSCIAGASAQLEKTGRLKLTVLRDR